MKTLNLLIATLVAFSADTHAQSQSAPVQVAQTSTSTAPMTDGEVRKVDKGAGKLTLRHGRIENLDMPGMTMVFRVADPKMLDGLNEGDKVRFVAGRADGAFTVTHIESAK